MDSKRGAAQLGGSRYLVRAVECLAEGEKVRRVCLDLSGADEQELMFVPDDKLEKLTEGTLETNDVTDGRFVNKKSEPRVFARARK